MKLNNVCCKQYMDGYDEGIDVGIDSAQCDGGDTICNDILSIDKLFVCQPDITTHAFYFPFSFKHFVCPQF